MALERRTLVKIPVVGALCACVALLFGQDACVLAEPSGALKTLPEFRPTIVHSSLVPPASTVITRFPSSFIVEVELVDPTVDVAYAAFIDYNPFTGEGLVQGPLHSTHDPNAPARTRLLNINIPEPPDLDRCHVVEVIVALRLAAEDEPKHAHTPDAPGGDIATWFYNPNGDLKGCPSLDGGVDAPSDGDAGEGGVQ
jgi:hypothetical protein